MFFKFFVLTAILLVCEGTIPDRLLYRRAPLRFIFNNQASRRPNSWNYQIVNGRPVISGFPNPNAFVAFGLNPQTGQIEQTQVVTQTRPGGPILNMIQNMLHVAGQFFGQLTGAFGNAVGGALQTANQFGQDIRDVTNPVISVTGISQSAAEKEPIQQPNRPSTEEVRPPITPPVAIPSTPSVETVPEEPKSEVRTAVSTIDQTIIALQTFKTNVQANFQTYFETKEGEAALNKVNEDISLAINKLQNLRETAITEPTDALQSGQNTVNTAFDNIENAIVGVVGVQGKDFIEPTRNELNKSFDDALTEYEEVVNSETNATEISPA